MKILHLGIVVEITGWRAIGSNRFFNGTMNQEKDLLKLLSKSKSVSKKRKLNDFDTDFDSDFDPECLNFCSVHRPAL